MTSKYDVIIIGAGAAGMCAAINIKKHNRSISVAILEQLSRVGKKLITTGNGRCNISNADIRLDRYHGNNVGFAQYALHKYDNRFIEGFFAELGVIFTYDETGRAYPYSLQASSVVDSMRFALDNMGVDTFVDTKVLSYSRQEGLFYVKTDNGDFLCKKIIVAAGLYSGGEKLGSNGSCFKILKSCGYKTVKTTPAIVQVKTVTDVVRSLKGIKVNALASLMIDGKLMRSEFGEVLFCDYGLSGPPVLQLSREVERVSGEKIISLDLMNGYTFSDICDMLNFRLSALKERNLEEFFTGMLNKRVGQALIKKCGLKLSNSVSTLKNGDIKQMASVIKNFDFAVTGAVGFESSQVTAGGLDTDLFDPKTMESRRERGLYCIGEILDIDGDCGGFNLQWAFSSAVCASNAVCDAFGA